MSYILLALTLAALVMAFLAWRRANALQVELVKTRSMVFDLSRVVREVREELKQTRRQVHLYMRQGGDMYRISVATSVRDAMTMHPGIRDVFASIHAGGKAKVAINEDDTIEQVASSHGKDVSLVLDTLNEMLEKGPGTHTMPGSDGGLIQIAPLTPPTE